MRHDLYTFELTGIVLPPNGSLGCSLPIRISWKLRSASIYLLQGPQGAGKSLTLAHLAGATSLPIYRGIQYIQSAVTDSSGKPLPATLRLRTFQFVPQDLGSFFVSPGVSDELHLSAAIGVSDEPRHLRRRLLSALGLSSSTYSSVFSLSQGQRRLLAVASALARKPPVLILDEPFHELSGASLNHLLEALKEYVV